MRGHSQSPMALGLIGSFRLALLPPKRSLYESLLAKIAVVGRLAFSGSPCMRTAVSRVRVSRSR